MRLQHLTTTEMLDKPITCDNILWKKKKKKKRFQLQVLFIVRWDWQTMREDYICKTTK